MSQALIRATVRSRRPHKRLRDMRGNIGREVVPDVASAHPGYDAQSCLQPQGCLGRGELQLERLRYGAVGDATLVNVESIAQMRILPKRPPRAFVRKRQHER